MGVYMFKGLYTQVYVCVSGGGPGVIASQDHESHIDLHAQRCCVCWAAHCGSHPRLMAVCSHLMHGVQLQPSCLQWVRSLKNSQLH